MLRTLIDLLGWLGTTLVFAAVAIRFLRPEWQPVAYWLAVSGLVAVLLYVLAHWREVARLFARRQARFGALAAASVLFVIGSLSAINYLASRHPKRWDLTAAKQFTLSDQTKRILHSLEQPVGITVFGREDDFERFRVRLDGYAFESEEVSIEYLDVDKNPARAREQQVQSYGTVVLAYGGRTERVVSDAEQELTNALIKVIEGREPKVYFVVGHNERDITSSERDGYNSISEALANDNFAVETLVLAQEPDVPADASVVVIAGPETDLLPGEIETLGRYLDAGGKVFVLFDPGERSDAPQLTGLAGFLGEWGIEVGNDVVVDVSGIGQIIGTDASVPVAASYPPHPITDRFNVLTAYPLARSIRPVPGGIDGRTAQTFVETGARSWAETDISRLTTAGEVELDEESGDKPGPVPIAAAVSVAAAVPDVETTDPAETAENPDAPEPTAESRVAAIGDSDFAANYALGIQGNRDLFLNSVNWLAQQENLIAIRAREPEDRRITLTADQQRRVLWMSLVIIPGLVIGTGIYTWWQRR